jgi:hypothetical protein
MSGLSPLVASGNEIHILCFSLSRFDFLGSLDPILIRFDRSGGCAAGFVCDEPDFRLTDDNMRWVCWTDGAHVPPLLELLQSCRDFVHGVLKGSVNTPCSFNRAIYVEALFDASSGRCRPAVLGTPLRNARHPSQCPSALFLAQRLAHGSALAGSTAKGPKARSRRSG